jgi:hypothetical protein
MHPEKIEFYKNRTIGERFSVSGDFARQNWKILFKNIMYIGIPLALVQGYFTHNYIQSFFAGIDIYNPANLYTNINWINYVGYIFFSILFSLFLLSTTGAIINQYLKNSLSEKTGWPELKKKIFSLSGTIFKQWIIIIFGIIIFFSVTGFFLYLLSFTKSMILTGIGGLFIVLVGLGLFIFIIPPIALITYPVFFENASAWCGIKRGLKLGLKYWGSTFLTVFLGGLLTMVITYILAMPYFMYIVFNMGTGGFLGYVLAMLTSFVGLIVMPLFILFMSFQYTSIVEKEEGVSLQDKIEIFDDL